MQPSVTVVLAQIQEERQAPAWTTLEQLWRRLRVRFPGLPEATFEAALHRALAPAYSPPLAALTLPPIPRATRAWATALSGLGVALVMGSLLAPLAIARGGENDLLAQALAVAVGMVVGVGVLTLGQVVLRRWLQAGEAALAGTDTLTLMAWQRELRGASRIRLMLEHVLNRRLGAAHHRRLRYQVELGQPLFGAVRP